METYLDSLKAETQRLLKLVLNALFGSALCLRSINREITALEVRVRTFIIAAALHMEPPDKKEPKGKTRSGAVNPRPVMPSHPPERKPEWFLEFKLAERRANNPPKLQPALFGFRLFTSARKTGAISSAPASQQTRHSQVPFEIKVERFTVRLGAIGRVLECPQAAILYAHRHLYIETKSLRTPPPTEEKAVPLQSSVRERGAEGNRVIPNSRQHRSRPAHIRRE